MIGETLNTTQLIDGVEGKLTVELFDAQTNRMQEKVTTKNFISLAGTRHLKWAQRANYFKDGIQSLNPSVHLDHEQPLTQDHIVLSSNTSAASPSTEWHMLGKLIGYAGKYTYAGADTLLGSPNPSLCEATPTYTKWVFDWPTSAGNGTIGSIGWMNIPASYRGTGVYQARAYSSATLQDSKALSSTNYNRIARKSGTEYFLAQASSTTIITTDENFTQTGSFSVGSQFKASTQLHGIAWDNNSGRLWVLGLNAANASILASYNASGVLQSGPTTLASTRSYTSLTHDGTHLWSLVSTWGNFTAYRIDTSGNNVSNFAINFGPAQFVSSFDEVAYGIACHEPSARLHIATYAQGSSNDWGGGGSIAAQFTSSALRAYDFSGNEAMVPVCSAVFEPSSANRFWPIRAGDNNETLYSSDIDMIDEYQLLTMYRSSGSSYRVWRILLDGMGSRALLPSPITKTSSQTLRITYQMDYT